MALEGLGSQVGDAVALEVLRPRERLPTALLGTGEAPVVIMLPGAQRGVRREGERERDHREEWHCSQRSRDEPLKDSFTRVFICTVCVVVTWTCW